MAPDMTERARPDESQQDEDRLERDGIPSHAGPLASDDVGGPDEGLLAPGDRPHGAFEPEQDSVIQRDARHRPSPEDEAAEESFDQAGRLVAPNEGSGVDDVKEEVAREAADEVGLSAEEEAVHIRPEDQQV